MKAQKATLEACCTVMSCAKRRRRRRRRRGFINAGLTFECLSSILVLACSFGCLLQRARRFLLNGFIHAYKDKITILVFSPVKCTLHIIHTLAFMHTHAHTNTCKSSNVYNYTVSRTSDLQCVLFLSHKFEHPRAKRHDHTDVTQGT